MQVMGRKGVRSGPRPRCDFSEPSVGQVLSCFTLDPYLLFCAVLSFLLTRRRLRVVSVVLSR